MSAIDTLFKNYKQKIMASDKKEDVKKQLILWFDEPKGKNLIEAIVSGNDIDISEFNNLCHELSSKFIKDSEESSVKFKSFSEFDSDESELEQEQLENKQDELQNDIEKADNFEEPEELKDVVESSLRYIETSSIKPDKFDWYTFSGTRRKRYKYGSSEWTLNPGGIVGISKAKDFRNRHSFCILDQSKSQTIDITKHNADLLRKRCKPYKGNIAQIVTPTPSSRRVATASKVKQLNEIKADVENFYNIEEHDNGDYSFCPKDANHKVAVSDMVKYLSNIFEVEPVDSDEESTHWTTKDGDIVLKYQPDFKYVVTTRK